MKEHQTEIAVPPRVDSRRSWPLVLVLGVFVVVALALLFFFDPARHAFYPVCLFKKTTGFDCSGCGGLRSVHQLLRGNIGQAFQLNAMVVITLPLFGVWAVRRWFRSTAEDRGRHHPFLFWAWVAVVVILGFGILRNLPVWPFGVTPM
jgi:predicted membrane protein